MGHPIEQEIIDNIKMVKANLKEESSMNREDADLLVELGENVAKPNYRPEPRQIRISVIRKG